MSGACVGGGSGVGVGGGVSRTYQAFKLLADPQLNPAHSSKIYRYDGKVQANFPIADAGVVPRDPRTRPSHSSGVRQREAANLPLPKFKFDQFYVAKPMDKEVTLTNINDNLKGNDLEEMCKQFGEVEEAKVYLHPVSKKHLGIGKVLFRTTRAASECAQRLDNTCKLGNRMSVFLDTIGKHRRKLIHDLVHHSHSAEEAASATLAAASASSASSRKVPAARIHQTRPAVGGHVFSSADQQQQQQQQPPENLKDRLSRLLEGTSLMPDGLAEVADGGARQPASAQLQQQELQFEQQQQQQQQPELQHEQLEAMEATTPRLPLLPPPTPPPASLLPTPMPPQAEANSGECLATLTHSNAELVANSVLDGVLTDLREVLQKDVLKRAIENDVFQQFEDWWSSQLAARAGGERSFNSRRIATKLEQELTVKQELAGTGLDEFASASATTLAGSAGTGIGADEKNPYASISTLTGFSLSRGGLRASLPKIQRRQRQPTPPPRADADSRRWRHRRDRRDSSERRSRRHSGGSRRRRRSGRSSRPAASSASSAAASSASGGSDESEQEQEAQPKPPPAVDADVGGEKAAAVTGKRRESGSASEQASTPPSLSASASSSSSSSPSSSSSDSEAEEAQPAAKELKKSGAAGGRIATKIRAKTRPLPPPAKMEPRRPLPKLKKKRGPAKVIAHPDSDAEFANEMAEEEEEKVSSEASDSELAAVSQSAEAADDSDSDASLPSGSSDDDDDNDDEEEGTASDSSSSSTSSAAEQHSISDVEEAVADTHPHLPVSDVELLLLKQQKQPLAPECSLLGDWPQQLLREHNYCTQPQKATAKRPAAAAGRLQPAAKKPRTTVVPAPPPKPKPKAFASRSLAEEASIAERILTGRVTVEERQLLKAAYERLVADANNSWLSDTHWADHPPTVPAPPAAAAASQRRGVGVVKEPHASGCARTEGVYRLTFKQKLALYLQHQQQQSAADTAARFAAEAGADSEELAAKKAKLSQTREARSMQRRILAEFADIEIGDLLKFNQLKFRKKKLKFDRSSIHSWGLFAQENIAQDEMVIEYTGQIIRRSVAEIREQNYEREGIGSSYLFRVDDVNVIDATKSGNNARFINHSCNPNCYAKVITVDSEKKIVIYSKREIRCNEEITYDYKFPYEEEKIRCLCGTANCRGTLN